MNKVKLTSLAKNLEKEYPCSLHTMLGGYVILARCLEKCRSFLVGLNGEYNYWPCSLCAELESFTGVDHEEFKDFVATGASDQEVAGWVNSKSKVKEKIEIIHWNNKMRGMRPCEMWVSREKRLQV